MKDRNRKARIRPRLDKQEPTPLNWEEGAGERRSGDCGQPAFQVTRNEVKCDDAGCDWVQEIPFADVPQWLDRACPACGTSIIITAADMIVWSMMQEALDWGLVVEPGTPMATATIDTAELAHSAGPPEGFAPIGAQRGPSISANGAAESEVDRT